ncbi:selenocysteine-specific translation elongation factor [Streptomyces coffeae]|uniref:Selenocysteine-specific translation elongation factor n=1 Tax=Streptomyces coffeae TaxID=621382 RepID=A0ABS1N9B6_9ACTN|nr:selenocysteine-specific translation elongation factor [Streptomyces coffeae]MBL1096677.1 selenocysteine-specific translation elongation factor [Streptomyces coffeae]
MIVAATAGHVDHGKTSLIHALTGRDPDRLAEERRRGLTLDLGFAWCDLPSGRRAAFVDVPGHERYLHTMLAGLGPVRTALLVVAADQGWSAQSAEHADALAAFAVPEILLVITRCDLADPEPAAATARRELLARGLRTAAPVAVSAHTGQGLDALRTALDQLTPDRSPRPGPVRLWADRAFTVSGTGTVVTGTLLGGTLRVGDRVELCASGVPGTAATVRGLQVCERDVSSASGPTRLAVNLRRVPVDAVPRGTALLTPDAWVSSTLVDLRLHTHDADPAPLPGEVMCHLGTARRPARLRRLSDDLAQLRLSAPLPLHVGDRLVLRDPGTRRLLGATVLDPMAERITGRGAAGRRRAALASATGRPHLAAELARRGLVRTADLRRLGVPVPATRAEHAWLIDPEHHRHLTERLLHLVRTHQERSPTAPELTRDRIRDALGLPDTRLIDLIIPPELRERQGRIGMADTALPDALRPAADVAQRELASARWRAPTAQRWRELGVGPAQLQALTRHGVLVRLAPDVYLTPSAVVEAAAVLESLRAPFPVSHARTALSAPRRVVVPLLEHLDRQGITEKVTDDGHRRLR